MAFSLPNPTVPTNGQSLDATPLLANIVALANAIQSFDASQITAGTLVAAAFNASINPNTLLNETTFPFIASGLVWSSVSGLAGGMTSGVLYYNGIRVPVNSVASHTFTASNDTYVDIDVNGNVTYQGVSNNSASPSLTANSIRVAIIVTGSSSISAVNQGSPTAVLPIASSIAYSVTDSLGNLIYPTDPSGKLRGYRQITSTITTTATSVTQAIGLSAPAIIPTGRKAQITISGGYISENSASKNVYWNIWRGVVGSGTQISGTQFTQLTANFAFPVILVGLEAQAGSITYNMGWNTDSSATASLTASSTQPVFIKVELA